MKLLCELMSVRRIDDEDPAPAEDLSQEDQDRLPDEGGDEDSFAEIDLSDFGSDEGDAEEDLGAHNPYEEGTPEHEAWEAGYAAAQGSDEQDVEAEMGDDEMPMEEPSSEDLPPEELPAEDCEMSYSDEEWKPKKQRPKGNCQACDGTGWKRSGGRADKPEQGSYDYIRCLTCKGSGNEPSSSPAPVEDEGVNKRGAFGRFLRGRQADRKAQAEWDQASRAEKAGDEAGANKHFRRSIKLSNLLRTDKGVIMNSPEDEEGRSYEDCPACDGTGKEYDETCVRCGGKGYLVDGEYDEENNEEDLAYDQGRAAFRGRYYTHENPYPWGSLAFRSWMKGFAQAQDAEDRENADRATRGDQPFRGWEDDEENQEEVRPTGQEEPNFGHEHDVDPEQGDELDLGDEQTEEDPVDDQKLDTLATQTSEDPDKQGLIRKVAGAHLVYKRQTEDGTYEELWIYNADSNLRDELDIRKAILAGTDIPTSKTTSPDGQQQYEVWASGNAELLQIKGLAN